MNILKVGQGNASDMRRQFENRLKAKADRSQHVYMNKISLLDPGNLKALLVVVISCLIGISLEFKYFLMKFITFDLYWIIAQ